MKYPKTHYTARILLSVLLVFSAGMYIFNRPMVEIVYASLGFPLWVINFNATAKILGVIGIWQKKWMAVHEWAYSGITYICILALIAHLVVGDGQFFGALLGLVFVSIAYATR